ncbi:MAG: Rab family GTPase, partial [Candidatus Hodarchaeota archaeon]
MIERRMIYKIVILGDGAVGKTSLRMRFVGKGFRQGYLATIGADFTTKDIKIDDEYYGTVFIWDLAGQQAFSFVRASYYKGARGALLIFDVTRKDTFDNIKHWMNEISKHAENISVILVGNKIDLVESREVSPEMGEELARKLDIPYIETSALTGENVSDCFQKLTRLIREGFTTKLSTEEFLEYKRDVGIYELEELPDKIKQAETLFKSNKFSESAEIYRQIADTYRLERDASPQSASDPMVSNSLKFYRLSAEAYLKDKAWVEAAGSYDYLKSLQESIGELKESLKSFVLSAENYERAGNPAGAAWRYSAVASQFESNLDLEEAYNYYYKSWEAYLEAKEFSLIFEPVQKISLFYERQNEFNKIKSLWMKTIDGAIEAKMFFWAGQLRELYLNLYCSPENKDQEREKVLELYLQAAENFSNEKSYSLEARSLSLAAKQAIRLKKIQE